MGVSPTNISSRRSEESKPRVLAEALKYVYSIHDSQNAMVSRSAVADHAIRSYPHLGADSAKSQHPFHLLV